MDRKLVTKKPFTFFVDPKDAEEYIRLLQNYIEKSGNPIQEGFVETDSAGIAKWNTFIETLRTKSANGIINIGAIESKTGPQWLVKTDISSDTDPIMYEYYIGRRLNVLRKYIPNFVLTFGGFRCSVNLYDRTDKSAPKGAKELKEFCSASGDTREPKDFIVSEKIAPATSLLEYIKYQSIENVLDALIQILCALQFAQNELDFTHYDLHASNVIRQELPNEWRRQNVVLMYNLNRNGESDPNKVIPVAADSIWTVIDFGRSHVSNTPPEVLELWEKSNRYAGFKQYGLDPLSINPMFDVVRLVSQVAAYNGEFKQYFNMFAKDWEKCLTWKEYDMVARECHGNEIKNPLDMVLTLKRVCHLNFQQTINDADKIVWYGLPATQEFKQAVMDTHQLIAPAALAASSASSKLELPSLENNSGSTPLSLPVVGWAGDKQLRLKPAGESSSSSMLDFPGVDWVDYTVGDASAGQAGTVLTGAIVALRNELKKIPSVPLASSIRSAQIGGGPADTSTMCFYNGRLIDRAETIAVLGDILGGSEYLAESNISSLTDNELCQILMDATRVGM